MNDINDFAFSDIILEGYYNSVSKAEFFLGLIWLTAKSSTFVTLFS